MKKEEIYVKLTGKNREKVFKILDMFGEELTREDEEARKTGRYANGNPIKYFPELEFKTGGAWVLYQRNLSNKKQIKPRQLRNMLAQEHLKEGDVVVVRSGRSKWVVELTGDNLDWFEHYKSYNFGLKRRATIFGQLLDGNFIRYATEEERKLLQTGLQVGKWYTYRECLLCYQGREETLRAYGFIRGEWVGTVNCGNNPEKWEEAAPEEVEQALLREAKKRGLVEGCLTTSLDDGRQFIVSGSRHPLLSVNCEDINRFFVMGGDGRGYCIFDNGKWAVPIDKFAGLKQAHKNGANIQYRNSVSGRWCTIKSPTWHGGYEYRINPEEPKTTDGEKLARYGDVCKFYNTNPGVFVVGYLAYFGKAHDKKVYYCVGLDAPFYNAEPITKEEAIKLLFREGQ